MARRGITTNRLIAILGVAVLALGGLLLFASTQGQGLFSHERPLERAGRQLREQRGGGFEIRYTEPGAGRALCGYAGRRGQALAGLSDLTFISRPNRILLSDDPLRNEFRLELERVCPGFLQNPFPSAK